MTSATRLERRWRIEYSWNTLLDLVLSLSPWFSARLLSQHAMETRNECKFRIPVRVPIRLHVFFIVCMREEAIKTWGESSSRSIPGLHFFRCHQVAYLMLGEFRSVLSWPQLWSSRWLSGITGNRRSCSVKVIWGRAYALATVRARITRRSKPQYLGFQYFGKSRHLKFKLSAISEYNLWYSLACAEFTFELYLSDVWEVLLQILKARMRTQCAELKKKSKSLVLQTYHHMASNFI